MECNGVGDGRRRARRVAHTAGGSDIGSDRGTSLKVGAGVQYDIDQNFAIRGEAEHYRFDALGSKPSTNLYSIGVNYRF